MLFPKVVPGPSEASEEGFGRRLGGGVCGGGGGFWSEASKEGIWGRGWQS